MSHRRMDATLCPFVLYLYKPETSLITLNWKNSENSAISHNYSHMYVPQFDPQNWVLHYIYDPQFPALVFNQESKQHKYPTEEKVDNKGERT